MVLMFVGPAPGSTGGGINVTTLGILALVVRAVLRGETELVFSGRRIEIATVINAFALLTLAAVFAFVGSCGLLMLESGPSRHIVFEVFSALGTVGLSMGSTPHLTATGKMVIMILMFVGRVGPLTLLLALRPKERSRLEYPSASVMVG